MATDLIVGIVGRRVRCQDRTLVGQTGGWDNCGQPFEATVLAVDFSGDFYLLLAKDDGQLLRRAVDVRCQVTVLPHSPDVADYTEGSQ